MLLICRRDEKWALLCAWSNMKLTHSLRAEKKAHAKKHSPTLTERTHTQTSTGIQDWGQVTPFFRRPNKNCAPSASHNGYMCVFLSLSACLCVCGQHMLGLCRKHKQTPTQERVKASKCEQNYVTKAFTRIIITIVPLRCNSSGSNSNRRNSFERARSTATLALSGSLVSLVLFAGLSLSLGATVISSAAHPSRDPGKAMRALYFTWTCWLPAALVCVSVCA